MASQRLVPVKEDLGEESEVTQTFRAECGFHLPLPSRIPMQLRRPDSPAVWKRPRPQLYPGRMIQSWEMPWRSSRYGDFQEEIEVFYGLPRQLSGNESTCQFRRPGFDAWVRKLPWRRKWQPTPVFLPGGFHEQRSLVDYSPWGHKESDTSEATEHAQMRSILYAEVNYSFRLFKVCSQLLGKNVTLFHITFFPALSKSQILLIFLSQSLHCINVYHENCHKTPRFYTLLTENQNQKSKFKPTKS